MVLILCEQVIIKMINLCDNYVIIEMIILCEQDVLLYSYSTYYLVRTTYFVHTVL